MNYILNLPLPRLAYSSITLVASNTTASMVVFTVTGAVQVNRLWGVVTTAIGANHTAGHLRTNDQSATIDVTLNTGITLSGLAAGTLIYKESLTAVALLLKSNAAGCFDEPAAAGQAAMSPFTLVKKTAAVTTLDYRYTTTDTPTSGVIRWGVEYVPLSADGKLA